MPEIACTEPECTRGRIYHDNGMVGVCFRCSGRGTMHVDRHPLQDTIDGLRAELAEARAEIERLRTLAPRLAAYAYGSGRSAGHEDTVEGCYRLLAHHEYERELQEDGAEIAEDFVGRLEAEKETER